MLVLVLVLAGGDGGARWSLVVFDAVACCLSLVAVGSFILCNCCRYSLFIVVFWCWSFVSG